MENTINKVCSKCKSILSINDFYKDKQKSDGYTSTCKLCNIKRVKAYYIKNQNKCNNACSDYYIRHKEAINFKKRIHKDIIGQGTYNKLNPEHFDFGASLRKSEGESSFQRLLRQYKVNAKKRNLLFLLSDSKFRELTSAKCTYCGVSPKQIMYSNDANGKYLYNGIDRINNSIGYIDNNCVSACKICNKAKTNLTLEEWNVWLNRIINYHNDEGKNEWKK